jgi:ribonuclease-3
MDISRLEGKVISYKSLVIVVSKEKKTFHYICFEDNAIDGQRLFGVLSIDGKVIAKAERNIKKESGGKHPNVPILLQEKWIKNNAKLLKTTTFSL